MPEVLSGDARCTWEEAVRWYRAQPGNGEVIRANYFDLPVRDAAERYGASEEFAEVTRLLGPGAGRSVLDLGAGNGIASFAFAQAGWQVTALEPDPSDEVGAGAIRSLGMPIEIVEQVGPPLPLSDGTFDAVFARQVLHHVPELFATMRELHRILRPGGKLLALRDHVASNPRELRAFLRSHPLNHLYGGEHAWALAEYVDAARAAGFTLLRQWGPLESILNFHPGTEAARQHAVRRVANWRWLGLGRLFAHRSEFVADALQRHTRRDRTPGRIFSFLWEKKGSATA